MLLTVIQPDDLRWRKTLRKLSHDFYHLPEFIQLEADRMGGNAVGLLAEATGFCMFMPLILLKLDAVGNGQLQHWDATSPYGYPGPIYSSAETNSDALLKEALERTVKLLSERQVSSLFVRIHPLLPIPEHCMEGLGQLIQHGQTVWIDLEKSKKERWGKVRPRFRSYINRLNRLGLVASVGNSKEQLDRFFELYTATMTSVGASNMYFFSKEYMARLFTGMENNTALCVVTCPEGIVVSAGIFTITNGIAQYHLSGTERNGPYRDALKLLIGFGADWAAERGASKLHLGGGVRAGNDSLFQFKSGFSNMRSEFYTWRVVCNQQIFDQAMEKAGLPTVDQQNGVLSGFFPPYRAENISQSDRISATKSRDVFRDLREIVNRIRKGAGQVELQQLSLDQKLQQDLELDSLELAEMTVLIESKFGVDVFEQKIVTTVQDVINQIQIR